MQNGECRGKKYDGALQQCIQEVREPDERWLGFLKWLADRGDFNTDIGPEDGS